MVKFAQATFKLESPASAGLFLSARAHVADPHLVRTARKGRWEEQVPCVFRSQGRAGFLAQSRPVTNTRPAFSRGKTSVCWARVAWSMTDLRRKATARFNRIATIIACLAIRF
jgi:hypothetical protein